MEIFSRRTLTVAVVLAVLVLGNLLADFAMLWLMEEGRLLVPRWLNEAAFGILLSQVVLLGYWLGLGDGRWYVRLLAAIALTLCAAGAIGWAGALSPTARRQGSDNPWAIIAFILIAMMLASSLVASLLRRIRSWRLTSQQIVNLPPTQQFQIGDALLWMIPISGALAALRFVVSIEESFGNQLLDIGLFTGRTTAVVLAAMMAAFATRRRLRALVVMAIIVLCIGVGFAIPEIYTDVRPRMAASGPIAWTVYLSDAIDDVFRHEVFVLAAMVGSLFNCFVLSLLGWQLRRPGSKGLAPPLIACEQGDSRPTSDSGR